MSDDESHRRTLARAVILTGMETYKPWSAGLSRYEMKYDLLHPMQVVAAARASDTATPTPAELEACRKAEQKLYAQIGDTVSDDILELFETTRAMASNYDPDGRATGLELKAWLKLKFGAGSRSSHYAALSRMMSQPLSRNMSIQWVHDRQSDTADLMSVNPKYGITPGSIGCILMAGFPTDNVQLSIIRSELEYRREGLGTTASEHWALPAEIFARLTTYFQETAAQPAVEKSAAFLGRGATTHSGPTGHARPSAPASRPRDPEYDPTKRCELHGPGHASADCRRLKEARKLVEVTRGVGALAVGRQPLSSPTIELVTEYSDALLAAEAIGVDQLYLDSGASHTMVTDKSFLRNLTPFKGEVRVGNGAVCHATHRGDAVLNGTNGPILLSDVWHVPGMAANLLALKTLRLAGYSVHHDTNGVTQVMIDGRVELEAEEHDGLVVVQGSLIPINGSDHPHLVPSQQANVDPRLSRLHNSLMHVSIDRVVRLVRKGRLGGSTEVTQAEIDEFDCVDCVLGKSKRQPSRRNARRALAPGHLFHADLFGPTRDRSLGGARYLLVVLDDYTRKVFIFPMEHKSSADDELRKLWELVRTHTGSYPRRLHTDNGGEFISGAFKTFLEGKGTEHTFAPPGAHNQNGRAERMMHTLLDGIRTALVSSGLPNELWAEAASHFGYINNRAPHAALDHQLPDDLWYGQPVKHNHLRPFGQQLWFRNHTETNKLSPRYVPGILVGYTGTICRVLVPGTTKVVTTRDVTFGKSTPSRTDADGARSLWGGFEAHPVVNAPRLVEIHDPPVEDENPEPIRDDNAGELANEQAQPDDEAAARADQGEGQQPRVVVPVLPRAPPGPAVRQPAEGFDRAQMDAGLPEGRNWVYEPILPVAPEPERPRLRSQRKAVEGHALFAKSKPVDYLGDEYEFIALSIEHIPSFRNALVSATSPGEVGHAFLAGDPPPKSYAKAKASDEWEEVWKPAVERELENLSSKGVYKIVDRERGMRILRAAWVFTKKIDPATGALIMGKARSVADGAQQRAGIDYKNVFSPVAHGNSVRYFLSLVNAESLFCDSVDVKAAFLNGILKEDIYCEAPEGSGIPRTKVVKLVKTLYGLHQAPKEWNAALDAFLRGEGFVPCSADPCVYRRVRGEECIILLLHVDDQAVAGTTQEGINDFKKVLHAKFPITDNGSIRHFLGIEIKRSRTSRVLSLSLNRYLVDLLETFKMSDCTPRSTPLDPNKSLQKATAEESLACKRPYRELVGGLMYAAGICRPDLSFAVGVLARFGSCFGEAHWEAGMHVLRYIKGTIDLALIYDANGQPAPSISFVDADWGGDLDSRRSTTGFASFSQGALIAYKSKLQNTVALSTTEAEFMALSDLGKHVLWLRRLREDLGRPLQGPDPVYNDNKGAIALAESPGNHERTKHIDIRYHSIRERVQDGTVAISHVGTKENIADIFTKQLAYVDFGRFRDSLGLASLSAFTTRINGC